MSMKNLAKREPNRKTYFHALKLKGKSFQKNTSIM